MRTIDQQVLEGCGDNSCVVAKPNGPGTNGGCNCSPIVLRAAVWKLRADLDAAQVETVELRARVQEWEEVNRKLLYCSAKVDAELRSELEATKRELSVRKAGLPVAQELAAPQGEPWAYAVVWPGHDKQPLFQHLRTAQEILRMCKATSQPGDEPPRLVPLFPPKGEV